MEKARRTRAAPPFGTSWRATKMVVQGARERMFCHVAIRMPCSRSLACWPVDLMGAEMSVPVLGQLVGSAGLGGGRLAGWS